MSGEFLRSFAAIRVARKHVPLGMSSARVAWQAEVSRKKFQHDKQSLKDIESLPALPDAEDENGEAIAKLSNILQNGSGSGAVIGGVFSGLFYPALGLLKGVADSCVLMQTANETEESRNWLNQFSSRIGVNLERRAVNSQSSIAVVRKLKRNGMVLAMIDVAPKDADSFDVDFFGHPARTASGIYHLCCMTGTPIVPVLFERTGGRTLVHSGNVCHPDGSAHELAQRTHAELERLIARCPGQWWMWSHLLARWTTSSHMSRFRAEQQQLASSAQSG